MHPLSLLLLWLCHALGDMSSQEEQSCRELCAIAQRFEDEATMRQVTCAFAKPLTQDSLPKDSIHFFHCGNHLDVFFHRERKDIQRKFLLDVFRHPSFSYHGPLAFNTKDSGAILCETALALHASGFPYLSHANRKYDDTNCSQMNPVIFQPDYYFIRWEGFKDLIAKLEQMNIPFYRKAKQIIWRGSTTGKGVEQCEELPRVKIIKAAQNISWLDFGISRNMPICRGKQPLRNSVPETDWIKYRGILDIDGNVNAWGLFWRLFSGSVIFKVESPYTNAYISKMRPWIHFIPVSLNFSELANITRIVMSDASGDVQLLQNITSNARALAEQFTYHSEVARVANELSGFHSSKQILKQGTR